MDSWPVSCSMVLAHVCSLLLPPPLAVDKGHRRQSLPFRTSPSRTHLLAGRRRQAPSTREQQQQHAMGGAGRVGGAATAGGGGLEPPSPTPLHRATTVCALGVCVNACTPPLIPCIFHRELMNTLGRRVSSNNIFSRASGNLIEILILSCSMKIVANSDSDGKVSGLRQAGLEGDEYLAVADE